MCAGLEHDQGSLMKWLGRISMRTMPFAVCCLLALIGVAQAGDTSQFKMKRVKKRSVSVCPPCGCYRQFGGVYFGADGSVQ